MKYFLLSILIPFLYSCNTVKKINETGYSYISFGNGGGVTNNILTYTIFPDGKFVSKNSLTDKTKLLLNLKLKQVNEIYLKIKNSGIDTINYKNPGNIFYFIDIEKNNKINRIVWRDKDINIPDKVINVYYEMKRLIPKK
jgi:hypothetical protein